MTPDDGAAGDGEREERPPAEVVGEALDEQGGDDEQDGSPPSEMFRGMMAQMQQFGPAAHPLADEITSDHISSLIEIQAENSERLYQDRKGGRYHAKFIFVAAGLLLLALIGILAWVGSIDQVESIVTRLLIIAAGALGGWGYARGRQ